MQVLASDSTVAPATIDLCPPTKYMCCSTSVVIIEVVNLLLQIVQVLASDSTAALTTTRLVSSILQILNNT